MTNEAWRPAVPTGREEALSEEFPDYLREAVFRWMQVEMNPTSGYVSSHKLVDFQNASRTHLGFQADSLLRWADEVLPYLRRIDDVTFTNLADYLASTAHFSRSEQHPLERILSEGGSAWTVTRWNQTHARLTKRVEDGVLAVTREALTATDAASRKLQEAWIDAFGTNPRASVAYSHAVVAVETAALSVIPTPVSEPTLSNLFSTLEADIPKWQLILRDNEKAPGAKTLAAMLRTLWRGHGSRHGHPDYTDASLEEARAAVILAATLVQWFTSGVVIPVSSGTTSTD